MWNYGPTSLIYFLFLCGATPAFLACQSEKQGKVSRMKTTVEKLVTRIDLYGKVVDQQGQPIQGVEVKLDLTTVGPNPATFFLQTYSVNEKSDDKGYFYVKNLRGIDISISEIRKKGYDGAPFWKENHVGYSFEREPHPVLPDAKNPIVLHMRKKGEETFLVKREGGGESFEAERSGTWYARDLIAGTTIKEKDFANPKINGDPLFCDLKVQGILDPKTETWTMVLLPGGLDSGIIVSDKLLYEAPVDGYQPSYTIHSEIFQKEFKSNINEHGTDDHGSPVKGIYIYI